MLLICLFIIIFMIYLFLKKQKKNVKGGIVRILQHQIKVTIGDANLFGEWYTEEEYYCGYTAHFT